MIIEYSHAEQQVGSYRVNQGCFLIGYCQMLVILSEPVMNNAQLIIAVLLPTEVFFPVKDCLKPGMW